MLLFKQIQTMCLHLTTKKWYLLFKFTHNFKQNIYKNKLFSKNRLFSLIASVRISEYMWRKVISPCGNARSKTEIILDVPRGRVGLLNKCHNQIKLRKISSPLLFKLLLYKCGYDKACSACTLVHPPLPPTVIKQVKVDPMSHHNKGYL